MVKLSISLLCLEDCSYLEQKFCKFFFVFRDDVDLPMVLDYEIWKASQMLFQKIPYDVETDEEFNGETDKETD